MFTVEHEDTYTVVTTLDQAGLYADIEVILDDTDVVLRQFNEETKCYDLINISHQQFKDIIASLSKAEGAYYAS
jgi:carbamate kinase